MYPGDELVMYDCKRGRLGAGVAVAVDGVGAIPARPGEGSRSAAVYAAVSELLALGARAAAWASPSLSRYATSSLEPNPAQ